MYIYDIYTYIYIYSYIAYVYYVYTNQDTTPLPVAVMTWYRLLYHEVSSDSGRTQLEENWLDALGDTYYGWSTNPPRNT